MAVTATFRQSIRWAEESESTSDKGRKTDTQKETESESAMFAGGLRDTDAPWPRGCSCVCSCHRTAHLPPRSDCSLLLTLPLVPYSLHLAPCTTTCLFTSLESLAWSQQGFWQPSFCRKRNLWSSCFDGGNWVMFHSIAFLEKRECVNKLGMM